MYIELHFIQNFAPANLNRDDTNNPKDCEFGGVRRARISSQSLKRAIRQEPSFEAITLQKPGLRTKWMVEQLHARLPGDIAAHEQASEILTEFVTAFASKLDKDGQRTAVLLYLSPAELTRISDELSAQWPALIGEKERKSTLADLTKSLTKEFKGRTTAPDIALFGRMLAEHPDLNLDAACQVAHAISTHRITMEMDFYTAVDDLQREESSGAGMMGFTGYNSACFYRYARLDGAQLRANLGNDAELTALTIRGFLAAAVAAIPSAKQNSFAAHNPPSLLVGAVRQGGMGWSLANAFEKPVRPDHDGGYVAASAKALDQYWQRLTTVYGDHSLARVAVLALDEALPLTALAPHKVATLDAWSTALVEAMQLAEPTKGGGA
jgi:CRISPR system Cascade subunit CasC